MAAASIPAGAVKTGKGRLVFTKPPIMTRDNGGSPGENIYDGRIPDAAMDGAIDYKGRPANKATTGRWKGASFVMGFGFLERLAFFGVAYNLVTYLTTQLHEGSAQSITNVWNWGGVAWILPLLGGFVADAYLGRYRTLMYSLLIYLVGMLFLTLSVSLPSLRPPPCPTQTNCTMASRHQVGFFYFSLYVVAVGVGGFLPCFSSFGGDQFDEEDAKERLMKHSYFNYWWVAVTGSALTALTALVYIEDHVGFGWGYGIPMVGLVFAIGILLSGTRSYRRKRPMGSPLTQVAQVFVAAMRNHRVRVPTDPALLHEVVRPEKRNLRHTDHLKFLDKAAVMVAAAKGDATPPASSSWKLCTVTQVEEVKLLARVMPVWFTTLIFMVTVQQLTTVFLRQGLSMDLSMGPHFKIPPASLELSCTITALILIPLYDLYLVPFVRRFTGNERGFSLLQRIGIGLAITVPGMAVAALVERKRLKVVRDNGMERSFAPLPMSVFWLTPQYSIMGLAQVFAYMGQLEFFYDQAPDDMQSIGTALFTSNTGVAHLLCTSIVDIVTRVTGRGGRSAWIVANINESRLDEYYWMLAILSAVNFLAFLAVAMWYTYKTAERHVVMDYKQVALPQEAHTGADPLNGATTKVIH